MWLWWLLACGDAPAPDDTSSQDLEQTPWILPEDAPPGPGLDAPALEAAVQEAVDLARDLQAAPVLDVYDGLIADASETCPGRYYNTQGTYWSNDCTLSNGTHYQGFAFTSLVAYDGGAAGLTNTRTLYAGGTIDTDDGLRFAGSGTAALSTTVTGEFSQYISVLQGSFSWDGPEAADTWLASDMAPDFVAVAYYVPLSRGRSLTLDGGIGGLDAGVVAFDGVTLMSLGLGSACLKEPSGSISVRNPDGTWTDVLFDGPAGLGEPTTGPCDGCGEAWHRGERVGEVCADFSPLLDWDDRPW
jgi:hypothetical protein